MYSFTIYHQILKNTSKQICNTPNTRDFLPTNTYSYLPLPTPTITYKSLPLPTPSPPRIPLHIHRLYWNRRKSLKYNCINRSLFPSIIRGEMRQKSTLQPHPYPPSPHRELEGEVPFIKSSENDAKNTHVRS